MRMCCSSVIPFFMSDPFLEVVMEASVFECFIRDIYPDDEDRDRFQRHFGALMNGPGPEPFNGPSPAFEPGDDGGRIGFEFGE